MSKAIETVYKVDISELLMKDIQAWNESIAVADIGATNKIIVRVAQKDGNAITEEELGNMKQIEWTRLVRMIGSEITAIFQAP